MFDRESVSARALACEHAFQPIVSTSTYAVHGVEALARFPDASDGSPMLSLMDSAARLDALLDVERILVDKAVRKFVTAGFAPGTQLFCNIDNRIFAAQSIDFSALQNRVLKAGLGMDQVCWEVSERHSVPLENPVVAQFLGDLARSGVRVALDDFGIGMSNLERLLVIEPDYVKIDLCFIKGIATDSRKQAIVAKLCGLAHALGYNTIAEGVESEADFRVARDTGCDFAQGYLIERPQIDVGAIKPSYERALRANMPSRVVSRPVAELVSMVEPVRSSDLLADAASRFNCEETLELLPVVDETGALKGALLERELRQLLLSSFGRDLLSNRGAPPLVSSYVRRCPVADVHASVDMIVNSYVAAESASGLMLTDDGIYAGYLSNSAVLKLAAERDVSQARDENPLTRLPGNQVIEAVLADGLRRTGPQTFAVIDFDNFKAFNDRYGFTAGDRAIRMFSDAMRRFKHRARFEMFIGHIGGDDFFVSLSCDEDQARESILELCTRFAADAQSLYSVEDRAAKGIYGEDRFGTKRFFPLLRASAGILALPPDRSSLTAELVNDRLAILKTKAKATAQGLMLGSARENGVETALLAIEQRLAG